MLLFCIYGAACTRQMISTTSLSPCGEGTAQGMELGERRTERRQWGHRAPEVGLHRAHGLGGLAFSVLCGHSARVCVCACVRVYLELG